MIAKKAGIFGGLFFIVFGTLLLLRAMGILQFSIWESFKTYWPAGLILVGIAMICKSKWVAWTFLFITIMLGALYFTGNVGIRESRLVVQGIPAVNESIVFLNLKFGAGTVKIEDGSTDYLVRNVVTTSDEKDPAPEACRLKS